MRITITDKFLWDIYNIISDTAEVARPLLAHRASPYLFVRGAKNPIFEKYRKERGAKEFSKLIYYLKRNGYISSENLENKKAFMLTKNGIDKAIRASFKMNKPKRKDGKWVMLIFDIPSINKKARALLRSILCNSGYKMFQKSVWISPYDVSEKTEKLLQLHALDSYVKIFLIEEI